MTNRQKEEYITKIWKTPEHPAAFASPDKVYNVIKKENKFDIGRGTIKKILSKEDTYTVQKSPRRNFPRNRVIVSGQNDQWDIDLASMENVSKYNDGVKYLLVVIDIFSRFLMVKTLKDKKSATVAKGLKELFREFDKKPHLIRFDQGGEFKSEVKKTLKMEGVHFFYTLNSQIKANYAERVIKTLKNRIYSYFMENQSYRYINVLQKLVNSYNNTPHESLDNATPASVSKKNEDEIRYIQYLVRQKKHNNTSPDRTRISG